MAGPSKEWLEQGGAALGSMPPATGGGGWLISSPRSAPVPVEEQDAFSRAISQTVVPGLEAIGAGVKHAFSSPEPIVQVPGTTIGARPGDPALAPAVPLAAAPPAMGGGVAAAARKAATEAPASPQAPPGAGGEQGTAPVAAPASPEVEFRRIGGGYSPAHELYTRGPKQDAALMASFAPVGHAAEQSAARAQEQSLREQLAAVDLENRAMDREQAAVATRQKRVDELESLQQDYSDTVAKLGQMHLDSNRWWAVKSTPDKVTTGILAFLGGLGAMGTGGPNLAWEAIRRDMDADIEAQKFDYQTQMDRAKGAQNAFSMAMDRYGSEDAATAAARAAALDFGLARVEELKSRWKGADAQNAADELRAKLEAERQQTIASGFRYVPAAAQGPRYLVAVRGQVVPGTVSEAEAQRIALKYGADPSVANEHEVVKGGVQLATKLGEQAGTVDKRTVKSPFGDYVVRNETEAAKHDETITAAREIIETVDRIKELRKQMGTGGGVQNYVADKMRLSPGPVGWVGNAIKPDEARRMETDAKGLLGAINRQQHFGALDKGSQEILTQMVGDPTSVLSGDEKKLDELRASAFSAMARQQHTATGKAPNMLPSGTTKGWDQK